MVLLRAKEFFIHFERKLLSIYNRYTKVDFFITPCYSTFPIYLVQEPREIEKSSRESPSPHTKRLFFHPKPNYTMHQSDINHRGESAKRNATRMRLSLRPSAEKRETPHVYPNFLVPRPTYTRAATFDSALIFSSTQSLAKEK